ncbi:hypothetical protein MHYP_G00343970 [Metynnis hypsauchen]
MSKLKFLTLVSVKRKSYVPCHERLSYVGDIWKKRVAGCERESPKHFGLEVRTKEKGFFVEKARSSRRLTGPRSSAPLAAAFRCAESGEASHSSPGTFTQNPLVVGLPQIFTNILLVRKRKMWAM